MSALEGFIQGFAGTAAINITRNKQDAKDWYAKQLERANTRGVAALNERRERLRSLTTVTNTLMKQGGMPEDVLRIVVNEGPEAIEQATKIYETAAKNGMTLDADFWNGVIDYSTQVKGDDEPLGDFLSKSVGLFDSNLQAEKSKGGDPISAFMAAGLGWNALDRAQDDLNSTEVADGYSANDLLTMEQGPQYSSPYGSTGATFNLNKVNEAVNTRNAKVPPAVMDQMPGAFAPAPTTPDYPQVDTTRLPTPIQTDPMNKKQMTPPTVGKDSMGSDKFDILQAQPPVGNEAFPRSIDKPLSLSEKLALQKQYNEQYTTLRNNYINTNQSPEGPTPEMDAQLRKQAADSLIALDPRASQIPEVSQYSQTQETPSQSDFTEGQAYMVGDEEGTFVRMDEQGFPVFRFNRNGKPVEESIEVESPEEGQGTSDANGVLEEDGSPKAAIEINGQTLTFKSAETKDNNVIYIYTDANGGLHKFPVQRK